MEKELDWKRREPRNRTQTMITCNGNTRLDGRCTPDEIKRLAWEKKYIYKPAMGGGWTEHARINNGKQENNNAADDGSYIHKKKNPKCNEIKWRLVKLKYTKTNEKGTNTTKKQTMKVEPKFLYNITGRIM